MSSTLYFCPECRSQDIVTDHGAGDVVCRGCGVILFARIIVEEAEWRSFAEDPNSERHNRCGEVQIDGIGEASLLTMVKPNKKGLKLVSSNCQAMLSTEDRLLLKGLNKASALGNRIGASRTMMEHAHSVLKGLSKDGANKKVANDVVVAASVYIGCRKVGLPRSIKEIAKAGEVCKKKLAKCYMLLVKSLKLDMGHTSTSEYVGLFCGKLSLSRNGQRVANDVADRVTKLGLCDGKNPVMVAAAIIYIVAAFVGEKRELSHVTNECSTPMQATQSLCRIMNERRYEIFDGIKI